MIMTAFIPVIALNKKSTLGNRKSKEEITVPRFKRGSLLDTAQMTDRFINSDHCAPLLKVEADKYDNSA